MKERGMVIEDVLHNKYKKIPLTRLKELRERNDMTKSYVADMLNRTLSAVSHHETHTRGMSHANIMRYCSVFHCYSYEIYDITNLDNYLDEMRNKARLKPSEVATLTAIPDADVLAHLGGVSVPRHGDIRRYARLFKVFTHQIFVRAEYTPDIWMDEGIMPVDVEEEYADPILYSYDGLIPVDNSLTVKTNRKKGEKKVGKRPINMHPDVQGKRARRVPVEKR